MLNHRELNKISSRLVIGDEYFLKNWGAVGIYLGKSPNYNYHYFVLDSGIKQRTNLTGVYQDQFNIRLRKNASKFVSNLDKCSIVVLDRWSIRTSCLKTTYTNSFNLTSLSNLIMTPSVKESLKRVVRTNATGSSSRLIANFLLSRLPIDLCNLNEVGLLTTFKSIDGTQLVSLNTERMKRLAREDRHVISEESIDKMTQPVKIGKVVKKITGEMFTNVEIEKFTHEFNSYVETSDKYTTEIVKGKDIVKWYNISSYTKEEHGSLHNSCMRYSKCTSQIAFYAAHPNCSLLIVKKNEKLYGRALLWNLHDGKRYLDRIYASSELIRAGITKWGKENGIDYFYAEKDYITSGALLVETNLNEIDYKGCSFPYMDSFGNLTGNFKYLVLLANSRHITTAQMESIYETGLLGLSGDVEEYLRVHKKNVCPEGKVRIKRYDDLYGVYYEDKDKCVFLRDYYSYFCKTHIGENNKPLTGEALNKVLGEEAKQTKRVAMVQAPF